MSQTFDRREFVAGYLAEVDEHLRSANANLLEVEAMLGRNEAHARQVRELFRSLHTLKGLSAMVGVDPVVDLAHEMESVLRKADRGAGTLSLPIVEVLLKGVHAIELRVRAFADGEPVPAAPPELLQALTNLESSSAASPAPAPGALLLEPQLLAKLSPGEQQQLAEGPARGRRAVRLEFVPSAARSADGITITSVRERVGALAEIVKVLPRAVPKTEAAPGGLAFTLLVLSEATDERIAEAASVLPAQVTSLVSGQQSLEPASLSQAPGELDAIFDQPLRTSSIRVEVERLDDALEQLSNLVVTRFRMARALAALRERGADVRELAGIVDENARQLRDLRACITRARLVSVKDLLERVPLIVRGMSRSTGKRVRLSIEAGNTELDKAVAERVFPAIVHLVRNAVDHAIESPDERRRVGKAEDGHVTVSCVARSSTELELQVTDDGRGLDAARIAARAGRDVPRDAVGLLELITLPGLTTLDRATASSGRGMGMEIVKRTVELLGGQLELRTSAGRGTTFTLRVPLSVSILDCFSFVCGGQTFVAPVSVVDEIVELDSKRIYSAPAPNGGRVQLLERRGESIPLVSLRDVLSLSGEAPVTAKALVLRRRGEAFALGVERMLGQQEVVVRPLQDPLIQVTGITGATDLGDGKPTLILDLPRLVERAAEAKGVAA